MYTGTGLTEPSQIVFILPRISWMGVSSMHSHSSFESISFILRLSCYFSCGLCASKYHFFFAVFCFMIIITAQTRIQSLWLRYACIYGYAVGSSAIVWRTISCRVANFFFSSLCHLWSAICTELTTLHLIDESYLF